MPTNTNRSAHAHVASDTRTVAHKKKKKTRVRLWRTLAALFFVAAAALGVLLYGNVTGMVFPWQEAPAELEVTPEPVEVDDTVYVSVICYVPVGDPITLKVAEGTAASLPEGLSIDGYTFLGWTDERGNEETRSEIVFYTDTAYSARYAIAFRDQSSEERREPFLYLSSEGFFRPEQGLSRGEAVSILYRMLDTQVVGSGEFADVSKTDSCYTAAATLKDLGILSGSRLHPGESVTYGEFFEMLSKLFPRTDETFTFENVPEKNEYYRAFCLAFSRGWLTDTAVSANDALPRREAARIFNLLSNRHPQPQAVAMVGTILDIAASADCWADVAEAVVPHTVSVSDGVEVWTSSEPYPLLDEGLFFLGLELRAVGGDGGAVANGNYGGFAFDADGIVTSGDAALDALVRATLKELIDPADLSVPGDPSATGEDQPLKILFSHVTYDFSYLDGNRYEMGATGWENDDAYRLLNTGKGNCYCYAAAFRALARALGYDAVCYSGTVGQPPRPHGWVEIGLGGENYIFDPTLEYEDRLGPGTHHFERFFMRSYGSITGWNYKRADE